VFLTLLGLIAVLLRNALNLLIYFMYRHKIHL